MAAEHRIVRQDELAICGATNIELHSVGNRGCREKTGQSVVGKPRWPAPMTDDFDLTRHEIREIRLQAKVWTVHFAPEFPQAPPGLFP
jgi:hypothetical protein